MLIEFIFTTKIAKHTKGSDNQNSELGDFRVLRGDRVFPLWLATAACSTGALF
jgi:hypothetical protein